MTRDIDAGYKHLMKTVRDIRGGGFPEETNAIAKALYDDDQHAVITQEMRDFVEQYQADKSILRFHHHKPLELLDRLEDLTL